MVTTRPQAAAAADMLRTIRPTWDAGATTDAILEACDDHPFRDVIWAAITQATDPANRGPRTILFAGPHWPVHTDAAAETRRQTDRDEQLAAQAERRQCTDCDEYGYLPNGGRCLHGEQGGDASEAKRAARAAAAEAQRKARQQQLTEETR